jgi:hypothetical protein
MRICSAWAKIRSFSCYCLLGFEICRFCSFCDHVLNHVFGWTPAFASMIRRSSQFSEGNWKSVGHFLSRYFRISNLFFSELRRRVWDPTVVMRMRLRRDAIDNWGTVIRCYEVSIWDFRWVRFSDAQSVVIKSRIFQPLEWFDDEVHRCMFYTIEVCLSLCTWGCALTNRHIRGRRKT